MTSVAVVGAGGYVGGALVAELRRQGNLVTEVTRSSYDEARGGRYDVVINAAMPSGRFWAKNNPDRDFVETVQKTAGLVYGWRYEKFVQISSVSARCQLDTIYGRHKAAAEALCDPHALVVRLGPMFSPALAKGVLIDMLDNRPVFVAAESRYCFTDLAFVARWVGSNLGRSGLVEVGSKDAISLREVARGMGSTSTFEGAIDDQEILRPAADFPSARDVFPFLETMRAARA